jgi:hypothetical protein
MYFETPAPPGPPLSAAASARPGVCTTLKYQSRPIHMTPARMCSQRASPSSWKLVGWISNIITIATMTPVVIAPRTVLSGFIASISSRVEIFLAPPVS